MAVIFHHLAVTCIQGYCWLNFILDRCFHSLISVLLVKNRMLLVRDIYRSFFLYKRNNSYYFSGQKIITFPLIILRICLLVFADLRNISFVILFSSSVLIKSLWFSCITTFRILPNIACIYFSYTLLFFFSPCNKIGWMCADLKDELMNDFCTVPHIYIDNKWF